MNIEELAEHAKSEGIKRADRLLGERDLINRKRPPAGERFGLQIEGPEQSAVGLPKSSLEGIWRRGPREVLIAEGDSWFDLPWKDILDLLEDDHGFDVQDVAKAGDTIENMAYGEKQLANFIKAIEKALARGQLPRAILLSGGGNDVAGHEFAQLLNHADSGAPGLNEQIVDAVLNVRIRTAYIKVLSEVTTVCERRLGKAIPIILHGYDYPVADGRGIFGGWWALPGPWLDPGFRQKGYPEGAGRYEITMDLINRFNEMQAALTQLPAFRHVTHVNLCGTLPAKPDHKRWWADELHPTREGFEQVTNRILAALRPLIA